MSPLRALLALLALVAAAPAGSDGEPGGYALRLSIRPAPGGGAQRVVLPAAVMAALRMPDGRDLRVFDGRGRAAAIARADPPAALRRDALAVSPILGGESAPAGARMSVRLDEEGRARVAEVEGAPAPEGASEAVTGALLDGRGLAGAAERLELALDLPAGRPVRVTVEASRDLDGWRAVGERVLFRAPGASASAEAIPLHGAALDREWLRVAWRGDGGARPAVAVRAATLVSRAGGAEEVAVDAMAPALRHGRAVEFTVPFATPVASLRIRPAASDDAVAPVRVLGRNAPEEPWALLAEGTAGPDAPAIPLGGAAVAAMRIEADARAPGFAASPGLRFGFAPRGVAFRVAGPAPFTLAAGRAGAADPFLPLELVAGGATLAQAALEGGSAAPLALSAPDEVAPARRRLLLWAVLLAAVALLAAMAWALWRRSPAPPPA